MLIPLVKESTALLADPARMATSTFSRHFLIWLPNPICYISYKEPGVMFWEAEDNEGNRHPLLRIEDVEYTVFLTFVQTFKMRPCPFDKKNTPDKTLVFMA